MNGKVFEAVVLSGKGGTGKTSMVAGLAWYSENTVFADCDVDAADLHLVLRPKIKDRKSFPSGSKAVIDREACAVCGICMDLCRFHAIEYRNQTYRVDPYACEGCGLCARACPAEAIRIKENRLNELIWSDSDFGPMVSGKLGIGEENSGRLVAEVRKQAAVVANEKGAGLILVDGPPGIGCPAISSVTGARLVLAVTEPSLSAWHDLERLLEMTGKFSAPVRVVINKADLNPEMTLVIRQKLQKLEVQVLAEIPYEEKIIQALVQGKSMPEAFPEHPVSLLYRQIWENLFREITEWKHQALKPANP